MKIISQNRITGTVEMIIEEADDFWVAYNLIAEGDSVTSNTWRKIQKRTASGATTEASRVKVVLEIKVESVEYDKEGSAFRLHGKNTLQNDYVRIGQFHTLEIEQKQQFVLKKDVWDSMALDTLKQAANPAAGADLAVVLMQEGLANIYLIGNSVTKSRARVETQISRKYGSAVAGYEVSLNNFFHKVLQAFLTHVDFTVVRCALIASPGFTKDQFRDYMVAEAERKQLKSILQNKHRLLPVRSSSGYRHSLNEVLADSAVLNLIKDTKAAQQVQALKVFFNMMTKDPDRACYGPKHVEVAHEQLAIQTLLITDDLFRNVNIPTRRKYVDLVESVKRFGRHRSCILFHACVWRTTNSALRNCSHSAFSSPRS